MYRLINFAFRFGHDHGSFSAQIMCGLLGEYRFGIRKYLDSKQMSGMFIKCKGIKNVLNARFFVYLKAKK